MQKTETPRKSYSKPSVRKVETVEDISGLAMACCAPLSMPT
jgi:hypothetical protein